MDTCIFCKIIKGEIPCQKVYENKKVFAFLDINPVNKGHTLLIPKKHFDNIYEIPDILVSEIFKNAKKIGIAVKKTTKADGINIYMNNEKAAGQIVYHAHIHIIPRFTKDGFGYWRNKKKYTEKEMKNIAKKISTSI